ncbi:hypothetical protein COCNU_07G004210 [Cocos nucifera]|uniref:Uncharacterized protein n=1 Tax=Cocos nucifera TaxID=13894 RepID=A0A8K0IEX1_COCNU|nr:hypothetical protein COCNU_07G004210 [Cocos nucifera]
MAAFTAAFPLPPENGIKLLSCSPKLAMGARMLLSGIGVPSIAQIANADAVSHIHKNLMDLGCAGELLSMGSINHLPLSLFLGSPQPRKLKINFNGSLEANENGIKLLSCSPKLAMGARMLLSGIGVPSIAQIANADASNVKKERRKKPDPPCVVCNGSGRNDCHYCQGRGRTNCVHQVMLPKGEWPKWCNVCGGSGLGYCNRCLGTGEYRDIMGFHFMKINGNSS